MALENLQSASTPFAALARDLGNSLGDPRLTGRYSEAFRELTGTLDAIDHCFEQFFDALAATGRTYEQAEDSVRQHLR